MCGAVCDGGVWCCVCVCVMEVCPARSGITTAASSHLVDTSVNACPCPAVQVPGGVRPGPCRIPALSCP